MDDHVRLRTRLAGLCMVGGGVAMLVPPLLGPPNGSDDTRERLGDLVADPGPTLAKSLVFQLCVLLLIPGVAAIVGRVRGRGTALVVSGGVVYGAGLVGAFTFMVLTGLEVSLAGDGPIDQSLVDAADRMASSPAAIPALVLGLLLFHFLGLPWLTLGMVRARQLHWWVPIAASVGTACAFFGTGTNVEIVGWELLGVTLAYIGWTVARPTAPTPVTVTSQRDQTALSVP
jgi:hypothetical protein